MRVKIIMPSEIETKVIPGLEPLVKDRVIDFSREPIYITWLVSRGEEVKEGDAIIEGEVGKRIVEIPAPCSGTIDEILLNEGWSYSREDILGFINARILEE